MPLGWLRARPLTACAALALIALVAEQQIAAMIWPWPHDWVMYQLRLPIFSYDYRDRADKLARVEGQSGGATDVWLGDSLVEALDCRRLNPSCLNLGLSGDTVFGVLHRVDDYRSLARATRVYLLMGHNDLGRTTDASYIAGLYAKVLGAIPAGPQLVCHAVLPVDERATDQRTNRDIAALNVAIRATCAREPRARYLDLTETFLDTTGNLRADLHIKDGVHLNAAGNDLWIAGLRSWLAAEMTP